MVVLDTDILVAFLRNNNDALNKIKSYYDSEINVTTTSITIFELFRGAYASHNSEKNVTDVDILAEDIDIICFDTKSSKTLGKIYNELKKEGKLIDMMDMIISSVVIANNEILVTRNIKHFSKIRNLKIEKW